jgi:hypothetical protein
MAPPPPSHHSQFPHTQHINLLKYLQQKQTYIHTNIHNCLQ